MKTYYTLDRTESALAVLLDAEGNRKNIPLSALPPGSRDGDLFFLEDDGTLVFDEEKTRSRRKALFARQRKKNKNTSEHRKGEDA